jgi:hypothetical protein
MGRDDVAERPELGHRLQEDEPRRGAGVGLVAVLDGRPLIAAHRAGAGIGQQVDQHVVGVEGKEVPAGGRDRRGPLIT